MDDSTHVDFAVSQQVAAGLRRGQEVTVVEGGAAPHPARIVAIDALVDPVTRNAVVRARMASNGVAPGASVRVIVPLGEDAPAVVVPATALRKSPAGDHVFVLSEDPQGQTRAHVRPVRSGPVIGDQVVIEEGLEAGERVAAQGSFKLFQSVAVAVMDAAQVAGGGR